MSQTFRNLVHNHDLGLLLSPALVCLLSVFVAFALLNRAQDGMRWRLVWIWLAAAAVGIGLWSTHFLIMLGFERRITLGYDYIGIFTSVIPAILNPGIGFTFCCSRQRGSTWLAGTFIGAGFAMMHYLWMSAVSFPAVVRWHWDMVAVSILLCTAFSLAAVAVYRRRAGRGIVYPSLLLAFGMYGLIVVASLASGIRLDRAATPQWALDPAPLAIVITVTSLVIVTIALGVALIDRIGVNRKLAEAAEFKRLADEVILGAAERERLLGKLKRQYEITSAALDNMAHGLCMYDRNDRLIVWNRRYEDMSDFPEGFLKPGLPFEEVVRFQIGRGFLPVSVEQIQAVIENWAAGPSDREMARPDGRTYHVHREPLDDGGWILTHEDVTERRQARDRIAYLASHDELTGLPNRRCFTQTLQEAARAARDGRGFALLTVDLDRFKEVNDTLGHPIGDQILKETASRLSSVAGGLDFITRLGGDEFAIIRHDVTSAEAANLAARITELLSRPFEFDGHTVTVGGTVGIAVATPEESDPDELIKRSDLALYRAKNESRGSYCFFEPGMDARLLARRELERGLRVAVQKGEFELFYQPLLNVKTQSIASFEALVRWHHPTRGLLQPAEFIATAEDCGLIIPIGEWVLRQACRDAVKWPSSVHVSVNLSAAQLKRGDLLAMTQSALDAARLTPDRLEIELTESVLLHDEEWVRTQLLQLRALGVRIAMDDFGTGYSSLSYLRTFPFSKIKIDKSFVSDMDTNEDALAIIQATIGLSMKLGMSTTAEGVETAEELETLTAEGCTEIQGYHVSPPVPVDQVWEILGRYATPTVAPLKVAS